MKVSKTTSRQARRIHRWLVPIAAAPLLITAGTGSLYSLLLEQNIDAFWLLKLHTCLLYTSPSPRDTMSSRMPSSA